MNITALHFKSQKPVAVLNNIAHKYKLFSYLSNAVRNNYKTNAMR